MIPLGPKARNNLRKAYFTVKLAEDILDKEHGYINVLLMRNMRLKVAYARAVTKATRLMSLKGRKR